MFFISIFSLVKKMFIRIFGINFKILGGGDRLRSHGSTLVIIIFYLKFKVYMSGIMHQYFNYCEETIVFHDNNSN